MTETESLMGGRPVIDAKIDLDVPEDPQKAMEISLLLSQLAKKDLRADTQIIHDIKGKLITEYTTDHELVMSLILQSALRFPAQNDIFAVLTVYYCRELFSISRLIDELIPNLLSELIQNDLWRQVKLLLCFISVLVRAPDFYPFDKFCDLLRSLAVMLDSLKGPRGESLSRALIVALFHCPPEVSHTADFVRMHVEDYMKHRTMAYIKMISPSSLQSQTLLDMLFEVTKNKEALPVNYFQALMANTFKDLGDITEEVRDQMIIADSSESATYQFTLGETDRAAFPSIMLPEAEHSITKLSQDFNPFLVDIAEDILVLFGIDPELVAQQLLGLSMLLNQTSLTSNLDPKDTTAKGLEYIILNVIFADLFRIPTPSRPPAFHLSLLFRLIQIRRETIPPSLAPLVLNLIKNIDHLDVRCFDRFVSFFTHQLASWSFSWMWANWDVEYRNLEKTNLRYVFIRELCTEGIFFITRNDVVSAMLDREGQELTEFIETYVPNEPQLVLKYGEGATFSDIAASFAEAIKQGNREEVESIIARSNAAAGENVVLEILITTIFQAGGNAVEGVSHQFENLEALIRKYFNPSQDGARWQEICMLDATLFTYQQFPPVIRELIVYLLVNEYVQPSSFVEWFFQNPQIVGDSDTQSVAQVSVFQMWLIFTHVIKAALAILPDYASIKASLVVEVFARAEETVSIDITDDIAKYFFMGIMKAFGRENAYLIEYAEKEDPELSAKLSTIQNEDLVNILNEVKSLSSIN